MRDLGDAVIGWDTPVGRNECRRIFAAAAAMHNAFAGQHVAGLCPLRTRLSLFAPSTLYSLAADDHPLVGATYAAGGASPGSSRPTLPTP